MRRSIRWSLLGSYAITLLLVLGLLGGTLYRQRRKSAEDALRGQLEADGRAIAGVIEWDERDGFELELDPSYLERFRQAGEDAPFFAVRNAGGRTLYTPAAGMDPVPPAMLQLPPPKIVVSVPGPGGTTVWVRQGTRGLERELTGFGREVLLGCLVGFIAAMLGGLRLVRRVLKPIHRISDTASKIGATNLEERIDVARMETELGSLATTLNSAFDRLQGAVDRQVQFTADASHDLRTPLAVLKANIEWALRGEREPGEIRETLSACLRATDRMNATVEGLLALARSDAAEQRLDMRPLDLLAVAQDAVGLLRPIADVGEILVEVGGQPVRVEGDGTRLAELVTALVQNALQHAPAGGRVTVRTRRLDSEVILEVADTGPGIADGDLPHLFDRFYRADTSRRGGNGLGLAIARQIAESHGGALTAANAEGGGAVFTLRLPSAP